MLFASISDACADNLTSPPISIVPRPVQVVPGEGNFTFSARTLFSVENHEQAVIVRNFLNLLKKSSGITPQLAIGSSEKSHVCFTTDSSLKSEAYQLAVTPEQIQIKASDIKGFFYALQTIRLLLPSAVEGNRQVENIQWSIPAVTIQDEPRFGYRALMLDAARFFIPKENVLRIIDCMGMLKINTLHFHLTDDNGWRLEIKKYPRLTEVGAWRVNRMDVPFYFRRNAEPGEPTPIGGFYTQEDIKEMVSYAADRQIEIIPEIDMPAHSNAALAAYPQLVCPVVNCYIGVVPGLGGSNSGVIYCAGKDTVFTFLQDVLDEVMAIFPSRYIHLGGDEAQKGYWKKCPLCQERMKKEHLANEEDLQGYFMKRMSDYVRSKGREVIGWDELTNSSFLPEGVIIQGWRGFGAAALKAAEKGHQFIMTPARIMYLIRYQGPQWFEPQTYFGNNTLKDVYDYEPVQADWKPEYASLLMGVQASMWTEFCNKPEDVEYQLFPRLAALAEVAWTQPWHKNWRSFLVAMDKFNEHLSAKGIVFACSMYNIQHTVTPVNGKLQVKLECERPDVEIRYTMDGKEPTDRSLLYKSPLMVTGTQTIKCTTYRAGRQMGKTLTLPLVWNKATAKPVLGNTQAGKILVNGIRGSLRQSDFEWHSWESSDSVAFTIDLQKKESLRSVSVGCITNYGMAAHKPADIEVWVSNDNRDYRKVSGKQFTDGEIFREGTFKEDVVLDLNKEIGRYVRIIAKGAGECPATHVRPGQEARIYFDEVMIE